MSSLKAGYGALRRPAVERNPPGPLFQRGRDMTPLPPSRGGTASSYSPFDKGGWGDFKSEVPWKSYSANLSISTTGRNLLFPMRCSRKISRCARNDMLAGTCCWWKRHSPSAFGTPILQCTATPWHRTIFGTTTRDTAPVSTAPAARTCWRWRGSCSRLRQGKLTKSDKGNEMEMNLVIRDETKILFLK